MHIVDLEVFQFPLQNVNGNAFSLVVFQEGDHHKGRQLRPPQLVYCSDLWAHCVFGWDTGRDIFEGMYSICSL